MKSRKKMKFITNAAIVAALYVILTYLTSILGLASGAVQCRLSEALLVLPMFTPAAIPGLFVGCFLSNLLTGGVIADVVFGSAATLIGAAGAYLLRKRKPYISTSVNVLANAITVPFVLKFAYALDEGIMYFVATVGLGEVISCSLLGTILYKAVKKHEKVLF